MNLNISETIEIQKLSSSTTFLKMADSILAGLDRVTLAEILASYLYLNSKGRTNNDIAFYVATKKFSKIAVMTMNILAAVIPGLILDKEFRSVILGAGKKSLEKKPALRLQH